MLRRPPRSTRTYTLFPYTTLFRSLGFPRGRVTGSRSMVTNFAQTSVIVLPIAENWTVIKALRHSRRVLTPAHRLQGTADVDPIGPARTQPEPAGHPRTGRLRGCDTGRSEARRVGKECVSTCSSRWSPHPYKTKKHQK